MLEAILILQAIDQVEAQLEEIFQEEIAAIVVPPTEVWPEEEQQLLDELGEEIEVLRQERQAEAERKARAEEAAAREEALRQENSSDDNERRTQGNNENVAVSQSLWDKWYPIAKCESGYGGEPQWHLDAFPHRGAYSDARYYGGLQFNKSSWDWAGGQKYAYWPHHATAAQQIEIAESLLAMHPAGWGAWPACSRKVGYR